MGIYTRPDSISDALPYPLNVAADISALFEFYHQMQKEQKAAARLETDTAENLYTSPA